MNIRHSELSMPVLVLGIGNLFMGDDGIGARIHRLQQEQLRMPGVRVVDGGTIGLGLLGLLDGVERLIIVDAVKCGSTPGTIVRLAGEQVQRCIKTKLSVAEAGLSDLLAAAEPSGRLPHEIVLLGMEPAVLEAGEHLSREVASQFEILVDPVLAELTRIADVERDKTWALVEIQ